MRKGINEKICNNCIEVIDLPNDKDNEDYEDIKKFVSKKIKSKRKMM